MAKPKVKTQPPRICLATEWPLFVRMYIKPGKMKPMKLPQTPPVRSKTVLKLVATIPSVTEQTNTITTSSWCTQHLATGALTSFSCMATLREFSAQLCCVGSVPPASIRSLGTGGPNDSWTLSCCDLQTLAELFPSYAGMALIKWHNRR